MRRPKKEIQLTSYDELLGLEEAPGKEYEPGCGNRTGKAPSF